MFWKKDKSQGGVDYVIAGLGNPGKEYEKTRHNMGFLTVDILEEKTGISVSKLKFKALYGIGNYRGNKVMLVKPQTYMNLSGNAIGEIMRYYKVPEENLIVIYDDIDLELGVLRIRKKGSAGTHNGMKSIVSQLGTDQFPRIRVGIGDRRKGDLKDYVIGGMSRQEEEELKPILEKCADAALCITEKGIDTAMNRFNVKNKKTGEEAGER